MADFKLGRLKFVWKGSWTTTTAYVKDDIVEYNGQGWVCETPHTSAGFPADRDSGKWTKMSEGFSWKGSWNSGTTYQKNAVVNYLSSTWISVTDNNTNNPPLVLPSTINSNWELYAAGYDLSYVDQDVIPSADGIYDLGTPSLRFKDGYFSGNSIYLGPAKLEANATSLTITNGDGTQVIFADGGFAGGDVVFQGNTVTTVDSNANLELDAAGTGKVVALTNMDIQGNLDVTGDITLGGNLIIGDAPVDTVTVQADFTSDIIPNASLSFDLGSTGQRWNNLYINKINDLSFDRVEGKTYYVTEDGDDLEPGTSIQGAFATIKKALTVAVAGDTIKVGSGTFTEVFPLTVPAGVSIVGVGIRATKIVPTVGTNNKDAFLLSGESGVVDLTVADFFYDSIGDTGYAFRFQNGAVITTRSPYIERVTVLCRGSSPTANDPYGFLTGDAGRGAEVDGAKVTRASLEAAMLFNECTIIVPNSRGLVMKNGARVEWLTCFTYFADLAIEGLSTSAGRGGDGKTRITFAGVSGPGFQAGENIQYTSTDGSTVFNIPVETVSGSTILVDGKFDLLEGEDFTPGTGGSILGLTSGTTATSVARYDRSEFAAELRSIASANIYGNQGVKADGDDVRLQLMAHNFAYIGTGADLTNNKSAVVQANEVIELNGGRVYFNSVDQTGTWRVGDLFSVDFETGNVTFQAPAFDVSSLSGINFTNGVQTTIVDPTQVTTGNLTLAGNSLTSSSGNITIDPSGSADIVLNADVSVTGNLDVGGNITLAGNIVIGDTPIDTVTVQADFTSNLIPDADQTYDLGASAKQWRTIHVDQVDNGQISVKDNRIQTTQSNTNLEIDTAGTGTIELQSNTNVTGTFSVSGTTGLTGNVTLTGDLAVNGGDLTTNQTTFNLLNTTATTVNIGGEATQVDIGSTTGTTSINNNLDVDLDLNVDGGNLTTNQTSFSLINTNATTVNFAGAATSLFIGDSTGTTTVRNNLAVSGNTTITGNLTVNGTTTSINSSIIQVDDKNLELASVAAVIGITGNITSSATTTTVTGLSTTTGLIPGQTVTKTAGTGAFGTGAVIASVDSATQITVTASTANTLGTITFDSGGATDITANGGGVTVKGTTDKTFQYDNANVAWTSSESMNLVALEAYMIDGIDKLTETELFPNEPTATIGAPTSTITIADQLVVTNDLTTEGDILTTQTVLDMYPTTLETLTIANSSNSVTIGGPSGSVNLANNADIIGNTLRVGIVGDVGKINPRPNVQTFSGLLQGPGGGIGAPSTTLSGTSMALDVDVEYGTGIIRDIRIVAPGNYYRIGEIVTIDGTFIGGTRPANDITVTIVNAVEPVVDGVSGGEVLAISWEGVGPINTVPTTFELINNTATTINFGGQATAITMGAVNSIGQPSGTTTIRNNAQINGDLEVNSVFTGASGNLTTNALSFNLINDTVTTVNFAGSASSINIGNTNSIITLNGELQAGDVVGNFKGSFFGDDSTVILNGLTGDVVANDLLVEGQATFAFDVEIQGGDLVTNQTTFNLINDTATTLNIGQEATSIVMGALTGTMQLRNSTVQVDGDLAVNGGDITTNQSVFNFVTSGASELNMGGSAQTISIGSSLGTTTVNNNLTVGQNLTVNSDTLGTTNVNFNLLPANATTVNAFAAATIINVGEETGTTTIKSASTILDGDLTVKGGDLITDQTTFNLVNETATTVNFAGAASTITIGSGTGTTTFRQDVVIEDDLRIDGADLNTSALTFNLLNTTANTINLGGAATQVNIGNPNGATNINHSLNVAGVLTLGSADSTVARIDSADTSFYLTNTFVENLYMGGSATLVEIGSITGTTNINNSLVVDGSTTLEGDVQVKGGDITTNQTTFNLIDTVAETVNFAGAATQVDIGSASGTTSVKNNLEVVGDLQVQGGDLTTNQSTFNLINGNATTVNFAGGAAAVNIGANAGTTTIGDALVVTGTTTVGGHILPNANIAYDLGSPTNRFRDLYLSGNTIDLAGGTISFDGDKFNFQGGTNVGSSVETESTSFDLLNTVAQTINFGGEAFTINMGSPLGGQTNIKHDANVFGVLTVGAADSGVSRISVADTTAYIADTTAETLFFAGAATTINIGASLGTTTINHGLVVDGNTEINQDLTVNGNLTLTSLNTSGENNDFVISPQGTGRVIIEPQGGLIITPTTTGNINNTNIGATTRGTGAFTTLRANGQVDLTAGISSVDSTTGTLVVTGGMAVSENVNIEGNISAGGLTLRGTVLFENELAVPSGGTGAGQFNEKGILYGNSTGPLQSTAASDYQNPYTGTNQQTSNAILTTTAQGVPVWTDVIDCGTY